MTRFALFRYGWRTEEDFDYKLFFQEKKKEKKKRKKTSLRPPLAKTPPPLQALHSRGTTVDESLPVHLVKSLKRYLVKILLQPTGDIINEKGCTTCQRWHFIVNDI